MSFRHFFLRLPLLSLCVGGWAACDVPRPDNAYRPETPPTLDEITKPKPEPEPDAAAVDPDDPDPPEVDPGPEVANPPEPVDPSNPLSRLVGNYLMRVDVYSDAEVSDGGPSISTSNRVSNLLLAKLRLQDGKLVADETLCHQSYATTCLKNSCSEWKTEVVTAIAKKWFPELTVKNRAYEVDDTGKLTVPKSVLALGFTEDPAVSSLPSDKDDPRVWDTTPDKVTIDGLGTRVNARVTLVTLDCLVSAVQRFATAFTGQLDLSSSEPLTQKAMRVDTTGTVGTTIDAIGSPNPPCNKSSINAAGAADNESTSVVRFRKTDLANCPTSIADFEARFPGTSSRPAASELM